LISQPFEINDMLQEKPMSFKSATVAALAAVVFAAPAFAESKIMIEDAYARVASKMGKTGAAFMVIQNHGDEADRLIDAKSDIAKKVELHTHKDMGDGVMKMMHVEEGFAIPAEGMHTLKRGGDHVMFMGLNAPLAHGDVVKATLVFEKAGDMVVEIPVDLERKAAHGMGQGNIDHGAMKHGDGMQAGHKHSN
jgi:copper(I)-binding protein